MHILYSTQRFAAASIPHNIADREFIQTYAHRRAQRRQTFNSGRPNIRMRTFTVQSTLDTRPHSLLFDDGGTDVSLTSELSFKLSSRDFCPQSCPLDVYYSSTDFIDVYLSSRYLSSYKIGLRISSKRHTYKIKLSQHYHHLRHQSIHPDLELAKCQLWT